MGGSTMTHKAKQKHLEGYQKMLQRFTTFLDHAEEDSDLLFHQALDNARVTALTLSELSHDEAEQIAKSVKRDLSDAANFVNKTGKALHDWLAFDWVLIEERLWDQFSKAADKTRIQMLKLNQELEQGPVYLAGEITGPGTLQCRSCGELIEFHKVSHITPCPQCDSSKFSRIQLS